MKLTPQQKAILKTGGATGTRHGPHGTQWIWYRGIQKQNARSMVALIKHGLLKLHEVRGDKLAAVITDAGRQALLEATTGKVRLDKAVEGMVAAP